MAHHRGHVRWWIVPEGHLHHEDGQDDHDEHAEEPRDPDPPTDATPGEKPALGIWSRQGPSIPDRGGPEVETETATEALCNREPCLRFVREIPLHADAPGSVGADAGGWC